MGEATLNFIDELPTGDVDLGGNNYVRVYGFADIEPRLVEVRIVSRGQRELVLNLLPHQADAIVAALTAAAAKARAS
jgi:hypothetical protein